MLDELIDVLSRLDQKKQRAKSPERHERLANQMEKVFPGAGIRGPRDREYGYGLIDRDDEHVLHAALMSGANAIVTDDKRARLSNSRIVSEAAIEILTGDEFLANTVVAHRDQAVSSVLNLYKRRQSPPCESPAELLERLCRSEALEEVFDLLVDDLSQQTPGEVPLTRRWVFTIEAGKLKWRVSSPACLKTHGFKESNRCCLLGRSSH